MFWGGGVATPQTPPRSAPALMLASKNGHSQVIDLLKEYTIDAPTTNSRPIPQSRLSNIKDSFKKIVTKPFIRVKLQVTTSNIKTNPQREGPSTQTPVTESEIL